MKKSAETQMLDFLKANPAWWASGQLQKMGFKNKDGTEATPRSLVRRLEENTCTPDNPHGILEVHYGNKNHASYRIKEAFVKKKQVVTQLPNGAVKVEYVPVEASKTPQEVRTLKAQGEVRSLAEANSN